MPCGRGWPSQSSTRTAQWASSLMWVNPGFGRGPGPVPLCLPDLTCGLASRREGWRRWPERGPQKLVASPHPHGCLDTCLTQGLQLLQCGLPVWPRQGVALTVSAPPPLVSQVKYAGLSHFEEKHEDFLADTVTLRRRFTLEGVCVCGGGAPRSGATACARQPLLCAPAWPCPAGDDTLVRASEQLPGAAFSLSLEQMWDTIKHQKDLNLPAHKVLSSLLPFCCAFAQ